MRITILFLVTILACSCKEAPHPPEVCGISKWKVGEKLLYNAVSYKAEDEKVVPESEIHYRVELDVQALGKQNILSWTWIVPFIKADSLRTVKEKWSNDSIGYRPLFHIVYEVNEKGEYAGILNWKELKNMEDSIWDAQFKNIRGIPASRQDTLDRMKEKFLTRPNIEATLTKDINAFHILYGTAVSLSPVVTRGTALGNQEGGSMKTEVLKDSTGFMQVRISMELPQAQTKAIMNEMMGFFKNDTLKASIQVRDTAIVDMNKEIGWPSYVRFWRILTVEGKKYKMYIGLKRKKLVSPVNG
ncbi:MAG TPA: hypothetical protein VNZ86_10485 [Bacteroidia bacterium]|jgi:hypothetical protein|nr:hypothetical protein [Bacteroidia bacterium]